MEESSPAVTRSGSLPPGVGTLDESRSPPSPLSGAYLLVVISEPQTDAHKGIILQKLAKGERLIQNASEHLVTEILIHPQVNTMRQCIRNLLSSFTKYRFIIHSGYAFGGNGSWILQDGTFSTSDFIDTFQEIEVQRVIRAYEKTVKIDICCISEGSWNQSQINQEPFTRICQVEINPSDKISPGKVAIREFVDYVGAFVRASSIGQLLEPSDIVGNIRFTHPTLYVFPGGEGDAALFGINGFNMLVDGGFSRKACFWNFVRHLDRLDGVLLTRVNNGNMGGMSGIVQRKVCSQVYPQIGHFFSNILTKRNIPSPDGDKDKEQLLVNLIDEGHKMVSNLKQLQLKPHQCYRDSNSEPINLYHKVGHGKLDMYVISPAKDSREVKEFLNRWNNYDVKLFSDISTTGSKELQVPLRNLVSICALLVWQPANLEDHATRILFPGSAPQHKIFEGFEKMRQLEFLKSSKCTMKSITPISLTVLKKQKMSPSEKIFTDDIHKGDKKNILGENEVDAILKPITESKKPKPKKLAEKTVPREKSETKGAEQKTAEKITDNADVNTIKLEEKKKLEMKKVVSKPSLDRKLKSSTLGAVDKKSESEKSSPTTPKCTVTSVKSISEIPNDLSTKTTHEAFKSRIIKPATEIKLSTDSTEAPEIMATLLTTKEPSSTREKTSIKEQKPQKELLLTKDYLLIKEQAKSSTKMTKSNVRPTTRTRTPPKVSNAAKSLKDENNRKVAEAKKEPRTRTPPKVSTTISKLTSSKKEDTQKVEKKSIPMKGPRPLTKATPTQSSAPVTVKKVIPVRPLKVEEAKKPQKKETDITDSSTVSTPPILDANIAHIDACGAESLKSKQIADVVAEVLTSINNEVEQDTNVTTYVSSIYRKEGHDTEDDDEILVIETTEIKSVSYEEQKYLRDEKESEKKKDLEAEPDEQDLHIKETESEKLRKYDPKNMSTTQETLVEENISTDLLTSEEKDQVTGEVEGIIITATKIASLKDSDAKSIDDDQKRLAVEKEEKITFESASTTTAPTMPEDEKAEDIKQEVEEKYDKEETKERSIEIKQESGMPEGDQKVEVVKQLVPKKDVKTPDEVADLPVDDEAGANLHQNDKDRVYDSITKPRIMQPVTDIVELKHAEYVTINSTPISSPDEKPSPQQEFEDFNLKEKTSPVSLRSASPLLIEESYISNKDIKTNIISDIPESSELKKDDNIFTEDSTSKISEFSYDKEADLNIEQTEKRKLSMSASKEKLVSYEDILPEREDSIKSLPVYTTMSSRKLSDGQQKSETEKLISESDLTIEKQASQSNEFEVLSKTSSNIDLISESNLPSSAIREKEENTDDSRKFSRTDTIGSDIEQPTIDVESKLLSKDSSSVPISDIKNVTIGGIVSKEIDSSNQITDSKSISSEKSKLKDLDTEKLDASNDFKSEFVQSDIFHQKIDKDQPTDENETLESNEITPKKLVEIPAQNKIIDIFQTKEISNRTEKQSSFDISSSVDTTQYNTNKELFTQTSTNELQREPIQIDSSISVTSKLASTSKTDFSTILPDEERIRHEIIHTKQSVTQFSPENPSESTSDISIEKNNLKSEDDERIRTQEMEDEFLSETPKKTDTIIQTNINAEGKSQITLHMKEVTDQKNTSDSFLEEKYKTDIQTLQSERTEMVKDENLEKNEKLMKKQIPEKKTPVDSELLISIESMSYKDSELEIEKSKAKIEPLLIEENPILKDISPNELQKFPEKSANGESPLLVNDDDNKSQSERNISKLSEIISKEIEVSKSLEKVLPTTPIEKLNVTYEVINSEVQRKASIKMIDEPGLSDKESNDFYEKLMDESEIIDNKLISLCSDHSLTDITKQDSSLELEIKEITSTKIDGASYATDRKDSLMQSDVTNVSHIEEISLEEQRKHSQSMTDSPELSCKDNLNDEPLKSSIITNADQFSMDIKLSETEQVPQIKDNFADTENKILNLELNKELIVSDKDHLQDDRKELSRVPDIDQSVEYKIGSISSPSFNFSKDLIKSSDDELFQGSRKLLTEEAIVKYETDDEQPQKELIYNQKLEKSTSDNLEQIVLPKAEIQEIVKLKSPNDTSIKIQQQSPIKGKEVDEKITVEKYSDEQNEEVDSSDGNKSLLTSVSHGFLKNTHLREEFSTDELSETTMISVEDTIKPRTDIESVLEKRKVHEPTEEAESSFSDKKILRTHLLPQMEKIVSKPQKPTDDNLYSIEDTPSLKADRKLSLVIADTDKSTNEEKASSIDYLDTTEDMKPHSSGVMASPIIAESLIKEKEIKFESNEEISPLKRESNQLFKDNDTDYKREEKLSEKQVSTNLQPKLDGNLSSIATNLADDKDQTNEETSKLTFEKSETKSAEEKKLDFNVGGKEMLLDTITPKKVSKSEVFAKVEYKNNKSDSEIHTLDCFDSKEKPDLEGHEVLGVKEKSKVKAPSKQISPTASISDDSTEELTKIEKLPTELDKSISNQAQKCKSPIETEELIKSPGKIIGVEKINSPDLQVAEEFLQEKNYLHDDLLKESKNYGIFANKMMTETPDKTQIFESTSSELISQENEESSNGICSKKEIKEIKATDVETTNEFLQNQNYKVYDDLVEQINSDVTDEIEAESLTSALELNEAPIDVKFHENKQLPSAAAMDEELEVKSAELQTAEQSKVPDNSKGQSSISQRGNIVSDKIEITSPTNTNVSNEATLDTKFHETEQSSEAISSGEKLQEIKIRDSPTAREFSEEQNELHKNLIDQISRSYRDSFVTDEIEIDKTALKETTMNIKPQEKELMQKASSSIRKLEESEHINTVLKEQIVVQDNLEEHIGEYHVEEELSKLKCNLEKLKMTNTTNLQTAEEFLQEQNEVHGNLVKQTSKSEEDSLTNETGIVCPTDSKVSDRTSSNKETGEKKYFKRVISNEEKLEKDDTVDLQITEESIQEQSALHEDSKEKIIRSERSSIVTDQINTDSLIDSQRLRESVSEIKSHEKDIINDKKRDITKSEKIQTTELKTTEDILRDKCDVSNTFMEKIDRSSRSSYTTDEIDTASPIVSQEPTETQKETKSHETKQSNEIVTNEEKHPETESIDFSTTKEFLPEQEKFHKSLLEEIINSQRASNLTDETETFNYTDSRVLKETQSEVKPRETISCTEIRDHEQITELQTAEEFLLRKSKPQDDLEDKITSSRRSSIIVEKIESISHIDTQISAENQLDIKSLEGEQSIKSKTSTPTSEKLKDIDTAKLQTPKEHLLKGIEIKDDAFEEIISLHKDNAAPDPQIFEQFKKEIRPDGEDISNGLKNDNLYFQKSDESKNFSHGLESEAIISDISSSSSYELQKTLSRQQRTSGEELLKKSKKTEEEDIPSNRLVEHSFDSQTWKDSSTDNLPLRKKSFPNNETYVQDNKIAQLTGLHRHTLTSISPDNYTLNKPADEITSELIVENAAAIEALNEKSADPHANSSEFILPTNQLEETTTSTNETSKLNLDVSVADLSKLKEKSTELEKLTEQLMNQKKALVDDETTTPNTEDVLEKNLQFHPPTINNGSLNMEDDSTGLEKIREESIHGKTAHCNSSQTIEEDQKFKPSNDELTTDSNLEMSSTIKPLNIHSISQIGYEVQPAMSQASATKNSSSNTPASVDQSISECGMTQIKTTNLPTAEKSKTGTSIENREMKTSADTTASTEFSEDQTKMGEHVREEIIYTQKSTDTTEKSESKPQRVQVEEKREYLGVHENEYNIDQENKQNMAEAVRDFIHQERITATNYINKIDGNNLAQSQLSTEIRCDTKSDQFGISQPNSQIENIAVQSEKDVDIQGNQMANVEVMGKTLPHLKKNETASEFITTAARKVNLSPTQSEEQSGNIQSKICTTTKALQSFSDNDSIPQDLLRELAQIEPNQTESTHTFTINQSQADQNIPLETIQQKISTNQLREESEMPLQTFSTHIGGLVTNIASETVRTLDNKVDIEESFQEIIESDRLDAITECHVEKYHEEPHSRLIANRESIDDKFSSITYVTTTSTSKDDQGCSTLMVISGDESKGDEDEDTHSNVEPITTITTSSTSPCTSSITFDRQGSQVLSFSDPDKNHFSISPKLQLDPMQMRVKFTTDRKEDENIKKSVLKCKSDSEEFYDSSSSSQDVVGDLSPKFEKREPVAKTVSLPILDEKFEDANTSVEIEKCEDFSRSYPSLETIQHSEVRTPTNLSDPTLIKQVEIELKSKSISMPVIKRPDDSERYMTLPHLYKTNNLEDLTSNETQKTTVAPAIQKERELEDKTNVDIICGESAVIGSIKESEEPTEDTFTFVKTVRTFIIDEPGSVEITRPDDGTTLEETTTLNYDEIVDSSEQVSASPSGDSPDKPSQYSQLLDDPQSEGTTQSTSSIMNMGKMSASMTQSFYGSYPDSDKEKLEHKSKINETESEMQSDNSTKKDPIGHWGKPMSLPESRSISTFLEWNPLEDWGKPLELPSPTPSPVPNVQHRESSGDIEINLAPINQKGTPKRTVKKPTEKNHPAQDTSKNKDLSTKKNKSTKQVNPLYVDLAYVPHHGNPYYTTVEFFKRIRARYYVFSGTDPSKDVFNALLEAKKSWENHDLEVTIISTYDTDVLGYWLTENEEILANLRIDLAPSASRCTINLQDHDTSCSAYRLEF